MEGDFGMRGDPEIHLISKQRNALTIEPNSHGILGNFTHFFQVLSLYSNPLALHCSWSPVADILSAGLPWMSCCLDSSSSLFISNPFRDWTPISYLSYLPFSLKLFWSSKCPYLLSVHSHQLTLSFLTAVSCVSKDAWRNWNGIVADFLPWFLCYCSFVLVTIFILYFYLNLVSQHIV